jgi:translocation and assembly module TamA
MRMRNVPHFLAVAAAFLLFAGQGLGADPQPYTVTLKPTGDKAVDSAVQDASQLVALREKAPAGPFALVTRAREDAGRFQAALNSFGYYSAKITLTIAGHPIDDSALPDLLDHAPADPPVEVVAAIDPGPQFHIGRITIEGDVPPEARDKLGLTPGASAVAATVLTARETLLTAIREAGHPLAAVELLPVVLRTQDNLMDITLKVTAGPYANIGQIEIKGLKTVNEDYVRRRLMLQPGQRFSPIRIEAAREDLASLGVFSVVRVSPAEHLAPDGTIPILIDVTERPLHAVDASVGYSTDLGANFDVGWHHRNLFGNAEQLNLTAGMQMGGDAEHQPGYHFGAQFIKPDFLSRDQSLEVGLNAVKQDLQAYDQRAVLEKIAINRKLLAHWTVSLGVSGEQEEIGQQGVDRPYELVGLPMSLKYDNTTSLLDPTSGFRAAVQLTPTQSFGHSSATFTIAQLSGSAYFDLNGSGRSVIAMRGLVGKDYGAGQFSLPPDQRFYAGGSGTVRGYRYQSVGPQFPDGNPIGGTAVSAGSLEFRQRILDSYGVVAFVDAGQVTANGTPFTSNWRVGAGVGVRYYTSIGPLRLDIAIPVNRQPGDDAFELYIGIGQAF